VFLCNFVCFALHFQLGGIVKPNDGDCHLDGGGEYTHSKLQDYPSISQVNLKVRQNAINVIFAVTAEQIGVYNRLKDNVEGASSGMLSNDSSNVVDLVREQYNVSAVSKYVSLQTSINCTEISVGNVGCWSRVSSVSIVSDYGLGDQGSIPSRGKGFSSNLCVQTGSETHPASCTVGTGGPFPGA
jgi:hypothetical protein